MASIFLSYAREDRAFADKLARVLEAAGHSVWWDRHIDSGAEFAGEIEAALKDAQLVVVAWSQASAISPWVRDEAAVGRDTGRLLPVLVDGSDPPLGFRQFQAFDLSGWKGTQRETRTAALLQVVERRLQGKARIPPSVRARQPKRVFGLRAGRPLWAAVAALVSVIALAVTLFILRPGAATADPASLAVLPFKNIAAGDPYFAEGVAEEIANELSREPQFKVAGRTSSALFKDAADLNDVGRRLHVAYVLEGSVRSASNEVRVDVSLVDTRRGTRLWSQDYRGKLDDIFAIQDDIGQQVAAHVRRKLIARDAPDAPTTTTGKVYSLYVTARSLMRQREKSKIEKSIELLRQAVKLDPGYAPAWARLALALHLREYYGESGGSTESERIRYAEHAASLAPQLADAHAVLGLLLISDDNLDPAKIRRGREELEKAVKLNPNDAESWYWLHYQRLHQLDFIGALNALRRTAAIDPFFVHSQHFPHRAWDMGYREDAERFLKDRIANHPDPFIQRIAQSQLAHLSNDLSAAYQHAKAANEIASPDVKHIAEMRMGSVLLTLRLLNEAERFVPRRVVDLRRGKFTFPQGFRGTFPSASDYWSFSADEEHLLPKVLVKTGQSKHIVDVYDEAFSSPNDMAGRMSHFGYVLNAPLLAIALNQADRGREGVRVLMLADGMCRKAVGAGHSPASFRVMCSRVSALVGRKNETIRMLEQAVTEGWRPSEGEYPAVTDEPAYAAFRNEPSSKRIDALIGSENSRERRELLAAGL